MKDIVIGATGSNGFCHIENASPDTARKLAAGGWSVGVIGADQFVVNMWPPGGRPKSSEDLRRALGLPVLVLGAGEPQLGPVAVEPSTSLATITVRKMDDNRGWGLQVATEHLDRLLQSLSRGQAKFKGPAELKRDLSEVYLLEPDVTAERFAKLLNGFNAESWDGSPILQASTSRRGAGDRLVLGGEAVSQSGDYHTVAGKLGQSLDLLILGAHAEGAE